MVIDRMHQKGPGKGFSELTTKAVMFLYVNHMAEDHGRKFFQIKKKFFKGISKLKISNRL